MLSILGTVLIADVQYGWTVFVQPIDTAHHWGWVAIQVALTVYVLMETWPPPAEGYVINRFGPRVMSAAGGLCVAAGWCLEASSGSLDRRGLAAGPDRGGCNRPP